MRKIGLVALAVFAVLVALPLAAAPVRLVMWGGVPPEAGPQAVCDNFNKEFADKGISIEYERFVNDDQGNMKLDTNLLSGGDIDLYMTYTPDFMKKRASGNMALDLSKLITRDKFDPIKNFGPMAAGYYIDGKAYCLPTKIDQYGIVVNKTMFDAAGIAIPSSWTVDEFAAIAKKLTKGEGENKVYGMFFNSQQDVTYPMQYFVPQVLGGDYFYKNKGKETNFTDPVIVKTYKVIANMMLVDKSAPSHVDSVTQKLSQEGMFLSGKSAMTIGSWIVRSVKNTQAYPHDFVTAFAPFPTPERRKDLFAQGGLGDLLCINPKSRNVEAAWTFAKWYSTTGMLPVVVGGRVPSYVNFDKDAILKAFLAGSESLLDRASTKTVLIDPKAKYAVPSIMTKLPEIKKVAVEEIEAALMGAKTVDQAMADAKKRGDAFLK